MSAQEPPVPARFRFGLFELDLRRVELTSNGRAVRLSPQPCKLLTLLVSRPGELITREEIRQHLWGDGTHVDFDGSLNFCMRQIRAALRDHGARPRYIATLPKRGYRFIAPVEALPINGDASTHEVTRVTDGARPSDHGVRAKDRRRDQSAHTCVRRTLVLIAVAAAMIIGSALFVAQARRTHGMDQRVTIAVLPFEDLGTKPAEITLGSSLTNELTLQLSRTSAQRFAVIARTSTVAYGRSPKPVRQIAHELDVSHLVEGTVQPATDGRVHLGITLVRTVDERVIWADAWERNVEALLPLQREVATRIARALRAEEAAEGSSLVSFGDWDTRTRAKGAHR